MPKAITVPPALNTAQIPAMGAKVKVKEVRLLIDQKTQIGTTKKGIGMTIEFEGKLFSQMLSLDAAIITGSAGRLLNNIGITDTDVATFEKDIQKFVGKEYVVQSKGGKIYWFP